MSEARGCLGNTTELGSGPVDFDVARYFFECAYREIRMGKTYDLDVLIYHQPGIPEIYFKAARDCHKARYAHDKLTDSLSMRKSIRDGGLPF